MIRFDSVSLHYDNGPAVLKDITFSLPAGSFYFLTGTSGAGKSSLLRLMYLGARPSRGHVTLFGKRADEMKRSELPHLRRRIGVVFQDFRLLPHLSALDNVALPLRLAGAGEGEIRSHVSELLRWVGLGDQLHTRPYYLSGGQQQRIAIARAVINRPNLLLADEPTGNVDDETGMRLMHLFIELNKLGTTVVIATHNRGLIQRLGKPQLVLVDGRLGLQSAS
jgi:cell division transport system ATP-binding protein